MSYILDALRKADAERARGSVPRLHTQPVASAETADATPRGRQWRWVGLGLLAALLAALGWWAGRESAPAPVPALVAMPRAEAPALPPPVAVVPSSPASLPAAPLPLQSPVPPTTTEPAPARASITLPAAAPMPTPAKPASVAMATAPPPAASRVPLLSELPADLRRQLPALAIGGSVHSDRPASRFVMINGQLLREGDTVAPGLVLESLRPKSAVFAFRGQRFELPY